MRGTDSRTHLPQAGDWLGRVRSRIGHRRLLVGQQSAAVHVRVLGIGPPLVMAHMSPLSSEFLLPLAAELAASFTCYLPDTPGYGLSDPLPGTPTIEDYARRLLQAMDDLSLQRPMLYGAHTGAKIALALAVKVPGRVSGVVLDGLRLTDEAQRRERRNGYASYFPPRRGGGHLIDTWHRVWTTSEAWCPVSDERLRPAIVAGLVRAELMARPWYGVAYRAAFDCDPYAWLTALETPVMLLARTTDSVSRQLATQPGAVGLRLESPDDRDGEAPVAACIRDFLDPIAASVGPVCTLRPRGAAHWLLVDTPMASVSVRRHSHPPRTSLSIAVNGLPWSATEEPSRADIEIDLPGSGASEWLTADAPTEANVRTVLDQTVTALGVDDPSWVTHGLTGNCVDRPSGPTQTVDRSARVEEQRLAELIELTEALSPVPSGSHLVDLWCVLSNALANDAIASDALRHILSLTVPPPSYLETVGGRSR